MTKLTRKEEEQLKEAFKLAGAGKPKRRDIFAETLGVIIGLTFPLSLLSLFIVIIVFSWRYILGL